MATLPIEAEVALEWWRASGPKTTERLMSLVAHQLDMRVIQDPNTRGAILKAALDARRPEEIEETPRFCPYCGGKNVVWQMVEWQCVSTEDPGNDALLSEHQCKDCDGRSFWT